jgi:hypothetical protein
MKSPFDRIEIIAEEAAARYRDTMRILRNQETGALMSPGALTPQASRGLRRALEQVGDTYLRHEEGHLIEGLEEMQSLAESEADRQMETQGPRLPAGFSDPFYEFGIDEIEAQVIRDVAQILKFHRKRALDVSMRSMARGISGDAALMEVRLESVNDKVNLWFTDRAGRRIASQKHVRRFYRGLMRDGYMSALSSGLALRGALSARIVHPDPRSKGFGEIVRLDGAEPRLSSFEAVFHPNAQASLLVERLFQEEHA